MGDMIVRSSGGLAVNNGPSVLGEQQAKIPVGGKIRPGIKVLTATGRAHPKAQGIYDAGVKAGLQWAAIEKALMKECGFEKSPMTPKNVQYFSVFRGDFANPAIADQILATYGEKVDGVQRLLRFPIIFPTDSWQANLPHALRCYKSSELQYWSDYDAAGNRRCFTRQPVSKDERNKRAVRTFGGRAVIPRPDTGGVCAPEKCGQYQAGACNLTGNLLFFIPGIVGGAAISLPFKSFYGMEQARQTMAMVAFMRGGRISGTQNGKPIFYITKKLQDVPMLDRETGLPKKVSHWIITLEADLDMLQVFQTAEQLQQLAANAGAAAAISLSAPENIPLDTGDHDDDDEDAITGELVESQPEEQDPRAAIAAARAEVAALLKTMGVTPEVFSSWFARDTQNPVWGRELAGLNKAKEVLTEALKGDVALWKMQRSLDAPF
jgi:hypothetical protein